MSETLEQTAAKAPAVTGAVPYIHSSDASAAAEFYKKAFAAEEAMRMPADDGKRLMHCHLIINGGAVLMSDCFPEHGFPYIPQAGFQIHLQVADGQAWWDRAVAAGCEVGMPFAKQFWGDTYGELKDPFGVKWSIGASEA
ncbi:glyoxalase/bleomycin resistance/extradiol dioxygenase family protein [Phenylobacterium sp.]|uniref:VOC family protein n=1 Tax=Phenylobacterium sp. TaxID=1871053 RepID=UPI002F91C00C